MVTFLMMLSSLAPFLDPAVLTLLRAVLSEKGFSLEAEPDAEEIEEITHTLIQRVWEVKHIPPSIAAVYDARREWVRFRRKRTRLLCPPTFPKWAQLAVDAGLLSLEADMTRAEAVAPKLCFRCGYADPHRDSGAECPNCS